jgi:pimeloyl-ACP methyl ester carboxylesterase
MHPRASQTHHFVANPLAAAGYGVLGCASRWESNDSDAMQEATLLDIAAAIKALKEQHQVQRVVAIGHSGGGGLFAFYQVQATTKAPNRFASAPSGDPPDLNKYELPPLDGFITLNGHRGEGPSFLEMLDPSIVDESDVAVSDPALDLFDPRNGYREPPASSRYSAQFLARYRAGQVERSRRLDAKAYGWLREQKAARQTMASPAFATLDPSEQSRIRRTAHRDRYMIIDGTYASPMFTDLSIDPSDRKVVDNLAARNSMSGGLARVMTARGFLSTWSGLSSRMLLNENAARMTIPTLVLAGTADNVICGRQYFEANFAASAAADKLLVWITGGDHGMSPVEPAAGGRDTQAETSAAILGWLRQRFPV